MVKYLVRIHLSKYLAGEKSNMCPVPAVYHHDIREELIWAADLRGKYCMSSSKPFSES